MHKLSIAEVMNQENSSSRRGNEDQDRDKLVYKFLFAYLTDLGIKDLRIIFRN